MRIVNLTQHVATADQVAAGVIELTAEHKAQLVPLLNFDAPPNGAEINERAAKIAELAAEAGVPAAMVGGALWLMGPLAHALRGKGIKPLFAFSRRQMVEEVQADGTVKKSAVFAHAGWVEAV